ncbi:Cytochrome b2, mitochondrial [Lecanosticta acicola]|uniref:L-lactate dehydrogenase (cytochrome) n=1 Tax=Lecanosticta acicola TaxID=111012 RepID=A0AAI8YYS4_9PEZI|nr:Cytochrome b2, mitochondrial [Lecanosticta acicola]
MATEKLLSVEEISEHNTPDDCWIVVDGNVWDLTEFAPEHPGAPEIIWTHAGRDATTSYSSVHPLSLLSKSLSPSKLKGRLDTSTITKDWVKPPPTITPQLRLNEKPPLSSIINAQDFESVAERTIAKKTWAFYSSADTGCLTRDRNQEYFGRILFRPRLLRDVKGVDTRTTVLGHEVNVPIFVAPAAMVKLIHPEGEKAIARGCLREKIAQGISTNASFPVEEIVQSIPGGGHAFFFQLYVNKDRRKSEELLRHVRSLGINTLLVTVDAPMPGKREADERVKMDESLSTPMSGQKGSNDRRGGGIGRLMGGYIAPDFTWDEFGWIRKHWGGKVVAKGVQSWQDAKMCAEFGLDGVLLSNHGGRNLDTSPPAILTLLECQANCPEIFSKLEVLVDSGIRRGSDVLKCLCLGATAVGLGRPFLFASNYGEEGVEHLIDIIRTELATAMALIGITDLSQCEPGLVSTLELDPLVSRGEDHPYAKGRRMEHYKTYREGRAKL